MSIELDLDPDNRSLVMRVEGLGDTYYRTADRRPAYCSTTRDSSRDSESTVFAATGWE